MEEINSILAFSMEREGERERKEGDLIWKRARSFSPIRGVGL